jgi:hypothetical protein
MANGDQTQQGMQLPQIPDDEYMDVQFNFTGQWLPSLDGALIGPENYQTLENLRYTDLSVEGVAGYEAFLTTPISTYNDIDNGFQFRNDIHSPYTYNLMHAMDTSDNGRVYLSVTDVSSSSGEIVDSGDGYPGFIDHNTFYYTDPSQSLQGRFSLAPQNSMIYCNGEDNRVWSGYKHRYAAIYGATDPDGSNLVDLTDDLNNTNADATVVVSANPVNDWDMEEGGINEYAIIAGGVTQAMGTSPALGRTLNKNAFGKTSRSIRLSRTAINDGIQTNYFTTKAVDYEVSFWVYADTAQTTFDWEMYEGNVLDAKIGATHTETVVPETWTKITATVTQTAGSNAYIKFLCPTYTVSTDDVFSVDEIVLQEIGSFTHLIFMTTRQQMAAWFEMSAYNTNAASPEWYEWRGNDTGWVLLTESEDTTDSPAGDTLGQDGYHLWEFTAGTAVPRHFQDLYLYSYYVKFDATIDATIKSIQSYGGFQELDDVWDGVYRQAIEAQFYFDDTSAYEDYTLFVNQSSLSDAFIAMDISWMDENDHGVWMFEEQLSGIKVTMLQGKVNAETSYLTMYYWNGATWTELSIVDGTSPNTSGDPDPGADGSKYIQTFGQSGTVSWEPPADEEKTTLFGSSGYAYKFEVSSQLTGTAHTDDNEVGIDFLSGIPALLENPPAFDFSAMFRERAMLGAALSTGEGNRMDYSLTSTPDVWNGTDTSMNGLQSLYYGGSEKLTGAVQLFNRFGSAIYSMLLVFKNRELYMLVGSDPDSFEIFPVSDTIGCPCPLTIAAAEVGLELGQGITRNIALWISHSGPMMFDGAVLTPIRGMETFFDPNSDNYVNWDYMKNARGWIDMNYKEYNVIFPTASATSPTVWIVYDLVRRKWFRKVPDIMPLSGWSVMDTQGEQYTFGGVPIASTTGQIMKLDKSNSWAGGDITQRLKTGDFWPTKNIWDITTLRKFTTYVARVVEDGVSLNVDMFIDTNEDSGAGVIWQDGHAANGGSVIWTDGSSTNGGDVVWSGAIAATLSLNTAQGNQRILKAVKDLNRVGWCHAFEWTVATNDTNKGFRPITWGLRFRIERKGDTATD